MLTEKNTFPNLRFGFLFTLGDPPPGLAKDHTFSGFFSSGNLPRINSSTACTIFCDKSWNIILLNETKDFAIVALSVAKIREATAMDGNATTCGKWELDPQQQFDFLFLDRLALLLRRCLERERVVNILIVRMPGAPSGFSFSFPCQLKTPNNGRKKWISYNLCLNFLAYFMFWGSFLGFEWQWLVRALLVTGWTHTRLSYQATISNWTFSWVEGSHIF